MKTRPQSTREDVYFRGELMAASLFAVKKLDSQDPASYTFIVKK
jgi:hypothetical protein